MGLGQPGPSLGALSLGIRHCRSPDPSQAQARMKVSFMPGEGFPGLAPPVQGFKGPQSCPTCRSLARDKDAGRRLLF